jgi:hypothetical protein
MFRISQGVNKVVDVYTKDQIEQTVRALGPGPWHIDQIERKPFLSGRTSRRWGVATVDQDGTVWIEHARPET